MAKEPKFENALSMRQFIVPIATGVLFAIAAGLLAMAVALDKGERRNQRQAPQPAPSAAVSAGSSPASEPASPPFLEVE